MFAKLKSPNFPWVVMHVPHDSISIPECHRDQFCLDDEQLAAELVLMTDHHTLDLFCTGLSPEQVVRAPVSRLVVDVERFEDDDAEPMAAIGMGAIYSVTSSLAKLRGITEPYLSFGFDYIYAFVPNIETRIPISADEYEELSHFYPTKVEV